MPGERHEERALEAHKFAAVLLGTGGAHFDDALVRAALAGPLVQNFGMGIERVADEHRAGQLDVGPAQVGDGFRRRSCRR